MTAGQNLNQFPSCPDCRSSGVVRIGSISPTNSFGGRLLLQPLDGGDLWRCSACHLRFRWPTLDKAELDALYAESADHAWDSSPVKRRDWQIAKQWLGEVLPEASAVLDVGCFDGGFLHSLGNTHRRYGIEIHPIARRRAEAVGITMIGTDFELRPRVSEFMDCVTAFDVIEHVQKPNSRIPRFSLIGP